MHVSSKTKPLILYILYSEEEGSFYQGAKAEAPDCSFPKEANALNQKKEPETLSDQPTQASQMWNIRQGYTVIHTLTLTFCVSSVLFCH